MVKQSLLSRIGKLETDSTRDKGVLFVDLNENGTFGRQHFTEQELNQYAEKHHYTHIIIDDIPETDE